jgi:Cysteine-rich secretory protein family
MIVARPFIAIDLSLDCLGRGLGGEQMLYSFRRDHVSVSSVGKKTKRLIAIIGFTLLASHAFADPQSEISGYRKSYGLSAVTVDPKLTELARQQANAMAERGSLDHNVYASFRSRMASLDAASAAENIALGTMSFGEETLALWKSSSGHNANLLKRNVTRIGLASASRHGSTYWALILAGPPEPKQKNVKVLSVFPFVMLMRIPSP